jgi:mannose-6-phosphate isomerase-like protein (cupin superfamily)
LGDDGQRKLVESYTAALEAHDIAGMLALLTEDAVWSMPPIPTWFRGHDAIAAFCRRSSVGRDAVRDVGHRHATGDHRLPGARPLFGGTRNPPAHQLGQEEVYIALRGSADVEVDGHRYPLDADHIVRVGPTARRKILPGAAGLRLLAIGGVSGRAYDLGSTL